MGGGGRHSPSKILQCYTSNVLNAVVTASATWYSDTALLSSTTQTCWATLLPSLPCLINSIRRLQENINLKQKTKMESLSNESISVGLRWIDRYLFHFPKIHYKAICHMDIEIVIMWPRRIKASFNFTGTGWIFQSIFLQSCICFRIPVL